MINLGPNDLKLMDTCNNRTHHKTRSIAKIILYIKKENLFNFYPKCNFQHNIGKFEVVFSTVTPRKYTNINNLSINLFRFSLLPALED